MSLKMVNRGQDLVFTDIVILYLNISKWNATQNGLSLIIKCRSKWNVTQSGILLKTDPHSKWNITQN